MHDLFMRGSPPFWSWPATLSSSSLTCVYRVKICISFSLVARRRPRRGCREGAGLPVSSRCCLAGSLGCHPSRLARLEHLGCTGFDVVAAGAAQPAAARPTDAARGRCRRARPPPSSSPRRPRTDVRLSLRMIRGSPARWRSRSCTYSRSQLSRNRSSARCSSFLHVFRSARNREGSGRRRAVEQEQPAARPGDVRRRRCVKPRNGETRRRCRPSAGRHRDVRHRKGGAERRPPTLAPSAVAQPMRGDAAGLPAGIVA